MQRCIFASFLFLMPIGLAFADDQKDLNGTWLPQEGLAGGEKLTADLLGKIKLVLADGKYTVTIDEVADKGTVKLDTNKKPKQMEIVSIEGVGKGKTTLAIYELTGDTLKICYDVEGKKYPSEFASTKENKLVLITYKRQR